MFTTISRTLQNIASIAGTVSLIYLSNYAPTAKGEQGAAISNNLTGIFNDNRELPLPTEYQALDDKKQTQESIIIHAIDHLEHFDHEGTVYNIILWKNAEINPEVYEYLNKGYFMKFPSGVFLKMQDSDTKEILDIRAGTDDKILLVKCEKNQKCVFYKGIKYGNDLVLQHYISPDLTRKQLFKAFLTLDEFTPGLGFINPADGHIHFTKSVVNIPLVRTPTIIEESVNQLKASSLSEIHPLISKINKLYRQVEASKDFHENEKFTYMKILKEYMMHMPDIKTAQQLRNLGLKVFSKLSKSQIDTNRQATSSYFTRLLEIIGVSDSIAAELDRQQAPANTPRPS